METWQLAVYGVACFLMSIISGIAGGGGGFVLTPLLIFLGLSPAQAVSTGKPNGIAITIASLGGMHTLGGRARRSRVIPVMILAFIVGLLVPFVIRSLDASFYRIALGLLVLAMVPVIMVKKIGLESFHPSPRQKILGGGLLTGSLFLQGLFGGGLGTLVNVVLMGMLGMTALEANITKRWSQLILNVMIVLGVLASNLIVWPAVAVGVPATLAGGYLGGRLAVKKGDQFALNVMMAVMVVSALALIFGAGG